MNVELRHVGHVVENLDRTLEEYRAILDLEPEDTIASEGGCRSALLPAGDLSIHLVEPGRGGARAREFLEKKGEGLYCLGLASRDAAEGAWVPPESLCGALIQILRERDGRPRERRAGRGARARISHVGHAVRSTAVAENAYERVLGARRRFSLDLGEQQVRSTMIPLGSHHSELLEPTGEKGAIWKFLRTRGEGLYHVCLAVADSDAEIAILKGKGTKVIEIPPTRELPAKTAWFRLAGVSFEIAPESLLSHLEATGER